MKALKFWRIIQSLTFNLSFSGSTCCRPQSKIRQITRPRFAIRQKLAALGIICVWTYEKLDRVIRLESESNTWILDEYGKY